MKTLLCYLNICQELEIKFKTLFWYFLFFFCFIENVFKFIFKFFTYFCSKIDWWLKNKKKIISIVQFLKRKKVNFLGLAKKIEKIVKNVFSIIKNDAEVVCAVKCSIYKCVCKLFNYVGECHFFDSWREKRKNPENNRRSQTESEIGNHSTEKQIKTG